MNKIILALAFSALTVAAQVPTDSTARALTDTTQTPDSTAQIVAVEDSPEPVPDTVAVQDSVVSDSTANTKDSVATAKDSIIFITLPTAQSDSANLEQKIYAVPDEKQDSRKSAKQREPSSFYFSLGMGARYVNVSYKEYFAQTDPYSEMKIIDSKNNMTKREYSGLGIDFNLKAGTLIANRLALFSNFELSGVSKGTYKLKSQKNGKKVASADFETDGVRFSIGGGIDIFLSSDTSSVFSGAFAGILVGIAFVEAGLDTDDYIYSEYDDFEISEQGLALGIEAGKLWKLTQSWNFGLTATATMDGRFFNTGATQSGSYTIGASLVLVHR